MSNENDQITRYLEGVKRYVRKQGMDLSWKPLRTELFERPAVFGDTAKKETVVKAGQPAATVVGTKEATFQNEEYAMTFEKIATAAFADELEKIALTQGRIMTAMMKSKQAQRALAQEGKNIADAPPEILEMLKSKNRILPGTKEHANTLASIKHMKSKNPRY